MDDRKAQLDSFKEVARELGMDDDDGSTRS